MIRPEVAAAELVSAKPQGVTMPSNTVRMTAISEKAEPQLLANFHDVIAFRPAAHQGRHRNLGGWRTK